MSDDLTPGNLTTLVLDKITELGPEKAREFFDVSAATIRAWRAGINAPSIDAAQRAWDASRICQTPELWEGNHKARVQILLPIYRYIHPLTHITLLINIKKYGSEHVNILPRFRTLIEEARNDLAAKFRASDSEWALFIDDDMILPVGSAAALHKHGWSVPQTKGSRLALERIMSAPKEHLILGGLYRDRRNGVKAQCAKAFGSAAENTRLIGALEGKNQSDGIEDAGGWCATGFLRIHRSVFDRMEAAAREPNSPLADILPPPDRPNEPIGFFGRNAKHRGEDVSFGRRAESIGIRSMVDVGCVLGHGGDKIW